jgi:hypothetical protein
MSFTRAESTAPGLVGLSQVLREALSEPSYLPNPSQVYENKDTDPLINPTVTASGPASRVELLQHLQNVPSDAPSVRSGVVVFCRDNLQQGPDRIATTGTSLGHVKRFDSLVAAVSSANGTLGLARSRDLLQSLLVDTGDANRNLARQQTRLATTFLSQYPMWCYPASDTGDPHRAVGATAAEAVNCLGLGFIQGDRPSGRLVRWTHTVPDGTKVCRPTAWDAGSTPGNVYWRHGGWTHRLDGSGPGVPEFVHFPVTGQQLSSAIEFF